MKYGLLLLGSGFSCLLLMVMGMVLLQEPDKLQATHCAIMLFSVVVYIVLATAYATQMFQHGLRVGFGIGKK